jgi:hypothetical protein
MADFFIERLNDDNAGKWEEFNTNSSEGSFYHTLKWKKIIENIATIRTHYYLLFKNNSISGIFPFVERNIPFFKGLIPVPDPIHLNAIIRDYRDPSVIDYVIKELQLINKNQKKISFICFSTLREEVIHNIKDYPMYPFSNEGNMILNVKESPPQKIWDGFSAKKGQRKFIRRFDETGFSVAEINSHDDLKLLYKYYQENINFIGGTLHPFSHFLDLWNTFSSGELRMTLLSKNSTVAGGLLSFNFKPQKTVYLHYLSLNRNLPGTYHPSYYLFWEAINWAWNNTYEKVSFGSQQLDENNTRYRVKHEFGANFEPVYAKMIPLTKIFTLGCWCNPFVYSLISNKIKQYHYI